jgi:hypothetical protein
MFDREWDLLRQEPELAGAAVCLVLAVSLALGWYFQDVAPEPEPKQVAKPFVVQDGPAEWRLRRPSPATSSMSRRCA